MTLQEKTLFYVDVVTLVAADQPQSQGTRWAWSSFHGAACSGGLGSCSALFLSDDNPQTRHFHSQRDTKPFCNHKTVWGKTGRKTGILMKCWMSNIQLDILVECLSSLRRWFCDLQDDDKPMIEIMDQLSPVILENFVSVAVSDTVSSHLSLLNLIMQWNFLCGIIC